MIVNSMGFQVFKVRGTTPFPVSMFRFYQCFPRGDDDARKIEEMSWENATETTEITLGRWAPVDDKVGPMKRWDSFGWELVYWRWI